MAADLPDAADGMIVRHLLTHTSGLIDYEDVIPQERSAQLHDDDVLRLLEGGKSPPFSAGHAIPLQQQRLLLAGADRRNGLRENDMRSFCTSGFSGLSTCNRRWPSRPVYLDDRASCLRLQRRAGTVPPRGWLRTDQSLTSATLGDGGIYSSVDDLAKWDAALSGDGLLRPASLRLAFRACGGDRRPAGSIRLRLARSPETRAGIRAKRWDFAMSSCATLNAVSPSWC